MGDIKILQYSWLGHVFSKWGKHINIYIFLKRLSMVVVEIIKYINNIY